MADKSTSLSITIRTVDAATAKIKAINAELERVTKPVTDLKKAMGELREKSGLDDVIGGFKGVGSAVGDLLGKVAMIGGVVAVAVAGLVHLVDEFEDLGKKAQRLGVGVDFLAQMRDSATRAGAPVEALDAGMESFSQNLGQARAGTGRMVKFLGLVSPALLQQLKAAKSNEQAFNLLADAMAKLSDPAKRAALAQKTVGDAALAPLLAEGSKALKAQGVAYTKHAGSLVEATAASVEAGEAMKDLKASTDGVKAALVTGLAPALKVIVEQISEWLDGHREDIKEWAKGIGEQLPGAFNTLVEGVKGAIQFVEDIIDDFGGVKNVIIGLVAVMLGPLLSAFITLGVALLTTPFGWFLAGVAAVVLAITELVKHWDDVKDIGESAEGFIGGYSAEKLSDERSMRAADKDVALLDKDPEEQAGRQRARAAAAASGFHNQELDRDDFLYDVFGPGRKRDVSGRAAAAAAANGGADQSGAKAPEPQQAKITVDFANMPRGARVAADPQSTADVDLSVGYQMLGVGQ